MIRNTINQIRIWVVTGMLVGFSFATWSCSSGSNSENKEASGDTTTTGSDGSVFGRQGDTTNNTLNAPEQAPPDSADARGAVVPAEVKVKPKN